MPSEPGDRHAGEEFLRAVDEVEMLTRLISTDPNTRWISSLVTGGFAPPEVAVADAAPAPVTPESRDGDGPRPPAVERVTDIG